MCFSEYFQNITFQNITFQNDYRIKKVQPFIINIGFKLASKLFKIRVDQFLCDIMSV